MRAAGESDHEWSRVFFYFTPISPATIRWNVKLVLREERRALNYGNISQTLLLVLGNGFRRSGLCRVEQSAVKCILGQVFLIDVGACSCPVRIAKRQFFIAAHCEKGERGNRSLKSTTRNRFPLLLKKVYVWEQVTDPFSLGQASHRRGSLWLPRERKWIGFTFFICTLG